MVTPVAMEPLLGYHPCSTGFLTSSRDPAGDNPGAEVGPKGLGCSPIKAVRELGSERRETVRSLSGVGVRYLRGAVLSTRGPGWTGRWCICCLTKGIAE